MITQETLTTRWLADRNESQWKTAKEHRRDTRRLFYCLSAMLALAALGFWKALELISMGVSAL